MHKIATLALMSLLIVGPTAALADTTDSIINSDTHQATNSTTEQINNRQRQLQPKHDSSSELLSGNRVSISQYHRGVMRGYQDNASTFMFNGITLNEKQRQQMRDLMATLRLSRQDNPDLIQDREIIRKLVIADTFDESAVRTEIEKQLQRDVEHRINMARVHHELYQLLTPEQKVQLEQQHQQRMKQFQALQQ
ncbi:Spy/CpxP family protein refolding chaperone [Moellerella wisconsensis]|uniref:Spy/CpxP family protein refolding chaperone n=1 Tax=Moellerella wisconsensis TaxID=158849 RepID=UPI00241085BD|nr:Spy/CpxP family protein refolding chaperone [Moellerella wisconsensis]